MRILVGLGNPGAEYEQTRHNLGFWVVDQLCEKAGGRFKKARYRALEAAVEIDGHSFLLVKPETFMNLSGEAVSGVLRFYKAKPESLVVLHDDLDLPLGRIKWMERGSAGGHHGIESIIDALGSPELVRLRLGIGRPDNVSDPNGAGADYVLSRFGKGEKELVEAEVAEASESVLFFLKNGLNATMNQFNRKK